MARRQSDLGAMEANVGRAIQKKKGGDLRKERTGDYKYHVEAGSGATPTRQGPYYNRAKAQEAQGKAVQAWRNTGRAGKKPELTAQARGFVATPGVSTPTYRVSPRTRTLSRRATLPGQPTYRKGDDTRRGA
jgi:hypothetical protein